MIYFHYRRQVVLPDDGVRVMSHVTPLHCVHHTSPGLATPHSSKLPIVNLSITSFGGGGGGIPVPPRSRAHPSQSQRPVQPEIIQHSIEGGSPLMLQGALSLKRSGLVLMAAAKASIRARSLSISICIPSLPATAQHPPLHQVAPAIHIICMPGVVLVVAREAVLGLQFR